MDEHQKRHLSIVNASGFPFQIATFAQIRAWGTRWSPVLPEHPWRHSETGRDGYIDFVLQNQIASSQRLVVECKRQRGDARWYFLDPNLDTFKVRYTYTQPDLQVPMVADGEFRPNTDEAAFCVLPGEDSSRRPTLERIADELLQSVGALAAEELALDPQLAWFQYLPVVLTTARLFVCLADPLSIPLTTGELPDDSEFREVPYLRFRKTLWSRPSTPTKQTVEAARSERERTILVVSGGAFAESSWNGAKMHHLDTHRLGDGTWLACVDGYAADDSNLEQPLEA